MMSMSCEKKMRAQFKSVQPAARACHFRLQIRPKNLHRVLHWGWARPLFCYKSKRSMSCDAGLGTKKAAEELPVAITTHR
jgi:hypothetical protein